MSLSFFVKLVILPFLALLLLSNPTVAMVIPYLFLPVRFSLLALQYVALLTTRRAKPPITAGAERPPQRQPEFEQQL
jgi:hypothetical protein